MKSLLLALMVMLSICSYGAKQPEKQSAKPNAEKSIVIYFSHAGDNYSVGTIKEGNTKLVADYICEITGADRFEIVAKKSYDMPYNSLIKVAQEEKNKGELPEFLGSVDVSKYDTIIIGGPIWWGTYPQVMFSFFKKYDLNGKTIIPFTTHEGSGMGSVVSDLKKAYPKATFKSGFSIYGHDVRSDGKKRVAEWLKKLDI